MCVVFLKAEHEKACLASDLQELQKQLTNTKEALVQQQLRNNHEAEQLLAPEAGPGGYGAKPSTSEREHCKEKMERAELVVQQEKETAALLEAELRVASKMARERQSRLTQTQEELLGFSEEMAALYHHVCACYNLTPQRVVLDYYREGRGARSMCKRPSVRKLFCTEMETSSSGDQSPSSCPGSPCGLEPLNVTNLTAVLREQLRHLQVALSLAHKQSVRGRGAEVEHDKEVLVEELLKLKSLLSTKREQIATLRTVLKANKQVRSGRSGCVEIG